MLYESHSNRIVVYCIILRLWVFNIDEQVRWERLQCRVGSFCPYSVTWNQYILEISLFSLLHCLYSSLPSSALFPIVPFLKNVGHLHGHKVFYPMVNVLILVWFQWQKTNNQIKNLRHCGLLQLLLTNMPDRLFSLFKAVRGLEMYLQWHGGSNCLHRPMLRPHYNRGWTSLEWWGDSFLLFLSFY